jgi:hypothetical protein
MVMTANRDNKFPHHWGCGNGRGTFRHAPGRAVFGIANVVSLPCVVIHGSLFELYSDRFTAAARDEMGDCVVDEPAALTGSGDPGHRPDR